MGVEAVAGGADAVNEEEAKDVVTDFIGDAHRVMADRMERALRRIAGMGFWERLWRASDVAAECLGIFSHWDDGFKK